MTTMTSRLWSDVTEPLIMWFIIGFDQMKILATFYSLLPLCVLYVFRVSIINLKPSSTFSSAEEISNGASQDCLEKLAAGLMSFYEPELKRFREQLAEVV